MTSIIDYDQVKMIIANGQRGEIHIDIDKAKYSLRDKFDKMHKYFSIEDKKALASFASLSPLAFSFLNPWVYFFTYSIPMALIGGSHFDYILFKRQLERIKNDIYRLDKECYIDAKFLNDNNVRPSLVRETYHKEFEFTSPVVFNGIELTDKVNMIPNITDYDLDRLDGESVITQQCIESYDIDKLRFIFKGCDLSTKESLTIKDDNLDETDFDKERLEKILKIYVENEKPVMIGGRLVDGNIDTDFFYFDEINKFEKTVKLHKTKERRLKDFFTSAYIRGLA